MDQVTESWLWSWIMTGINGMCRSSFLKCMWTSVFCIFMGTLGRLSQIFFPPKYTVRAPVRAPVFDRHQFFGTSEHYGKDHGILLSGWINYYYTACCWFPACTCTSNNIFILPRSITVLTNQVWKLLIALYKVPNTGAFTVTVLSLHFTGVRFSIQEKYEGTKRFVLKSI